MNNDEKLAQAIKHTQEQAEGAAQQLTGFLLKGAEKLKAAAQAAADAASEAIRNDINNHPQ